MSKKKAIIIGAGPAGLTAAYELLKRTDIIPIVLERTDYMGGISRTANYKGNRIDIGGHRFFSKSDRVMQWWSEILPLQKLDENQKTITYHKKNTIISSSDNAPDPDKEDRVMLVRKRSSRIYFNRTFFAYPLQLNVETIKKLGLKSTIAIGLSYLKSILWPIKKEENLEQFFINRFGNRLYRTFFKSYTEKVWGVPCDKISAEWGAQRIKGISIKTALKHCLKQCIPKKKTIDIAQKNTETSLIEQFLYPKYGPGHMWQEVADKIVAQGGIILINKYVNHLAVANNNITHVGAVNDDTGLQEIFQADYVFSTMPIKNLIRALNADVPSKVREISEGLMYRDFITVGLLLNKLAINEKNSYGQQLIADNWIYIQEPDVLVGRLQIFNNWSPYMVADPKKVWVGLEYFCYDTDEIWKKTNDEMIALGIDELHKIGIIDKKEVIDATVIRMEKTYPAYFGTYDKFDIVKNYLNSIENLFLIGRNGMHKYNNQDHSMLTAMTAVDLILAGNSDKAPIWAVNTEQEYHEAKR